MASAIRPAWTTLAQPEYNCSDYMPPGEAWTVEFGVQRTTFGIYSLSFGTLCELDKGKSLQILYIPCALVLWQQMGISCYKIMFWLAVVDMSVLACNSIAFGIMMLKGYVFCSAPHLIVTIADVAMFGWAGACAGCLILVANRLAELTNRRWLFEGRRTTIILVGATMYGLFFALFTPPFLFNSARQAFFASPFIPGKADAQYYNVPHTINNIVVVITSAILYLGVCAVLAKSQARSTISSGRRYVQNVPIFLQSFLICFFNLVAALGYVYMNFFPVPPELIIPGQICWQCSHGAPPFIYLCLNSSIRRYTRGLLGRKGGAISTETISKSIPTVPVTSSHNH